MTKWNTIEKAPKDGTEIEVQMVITVRAFWDQKQQQFILSRPLTHEYVCCPSLWREIKQNKITSKQ